MSETQQANVACPDCGEVYRPESHERPEARTPCPRCGSTRREITVGVGETIDAYDAEAAEILDDASEVLSQSLNGLAEMMAERRGDPVVRVRDVQEAVAALLAVFDAHRDAEADRAALDALKTKLREILQRCTEDEPASAAHA